jgi:hypothetical protein
MKRTELPIIGEPLQGGFYAGLVLAGLQTFAIIAAPKAQGSATNFEWGKYGESIPANAYSDGSSNTIAMAENGSAMAQWAIGLVINDHNDWYIPSRDELEIIYRNLKPTTDKNCCSFRDGDNPSAPDINDRYPYTSDLPSITNAPLFQAGGAEAFDTVYHWSSTQCSAGRAWIQDFEDGHADIRRKGYKRAVRAVRRVLVIE